MQINAVDVIERIKMRFINAATLADSRESFIKLGFTV